jgi:multidrug resistance efflux pump
MLRQRVAAPPDTEAVAKNEEPTAAATRAPAALGSLDAIGRLAYLRQSLAELTAKGDVASRGDRGDKIRHLLLLLYRHSRIAVRHLRRLKLPQLDQVDFKSVLAEPNLRKVMKSALFLAVAVVVGWGPVQRLMQTTSVEAVVNARLVTLRAPIGGEVVSAPATADVGNALASGEPLVRIVNRRADRSRLDDLRRTIDRLGDERAVLAVRLETARAMHAEFMTQTRQFQDGRVRQLEARQDELRNDLAAATARRLETTTTLQRTLALAARGVISHSALEKAQRDNEVAVQGVAAAEQRIKASEVELAAARTGSFVGDSYNDRPRSSQRADELQQQIAELSAELRQRDLRLPRLKAELEEEKVRYADLASASVVAPSKGSVWEVLTAPGEEVRQGQELARLLDCGSAVVTAAVSESVYNRLRVGQPARFRFREGGPELAGRVVHLTGVAAAPANFAIAPSALTREAYRVTVSVPYLAQIPTCELGRTGRVVFGDSAGEAVAGASRSGK